MAKVRVFSTPSCSYCVTLKEFLKNNDIEFDDIDVSKVIFPIIDIDGEIIIGFDKEKVVKLLNIKE